MLVTLYFTRLLVARRFASAFVGGGGWVIADVAWRPAGRRRTAQRLAVAACWGRSTWRSFTRWPVRTTPRR